MKPLPFDNSYARLPARFYAQQSPEPVSAPELIKVNHELSRRLDIDANWLASAEGIAVIAGNRVPPGAQPIAAAYAGHQFGGWNPQLGDGRAVLLGEVIGSDDIRYDIQLKGSGRTPWSRDGDGRAPLGPVLREYIVSEAMAALGIATSRSLAAVTTGDTVYRQQALPGAVLTRVARSHVRIGTFQYFAARQDQEALQLLVEHVLARHYPDSVAADNPTLSLLENVICQTASLVASWQLNGFIHGVMNTDNMLLSGETIDYGPCAFMDAFHPDTVFSSIDLQGRYAYCNQPSIAHWNLSCLAQALLPFIDTDAEKAAALAQAALDKFLERFLSAYQSGMSLKLGLCHRQPEDEALMQHLLELMARERMDFTLTFRRLTDLANPGAGAEVVELLTVPGSFRSWLGLWQQRLQQDDQNLTDRYARMSQANPAFIARNHLVEEAINAAQNDADFNAFHRLIDVLSAPFEYSNELAHYAVPPRPDQVVRQTFCGT